MWDDVAAGSRRPHRARGRPAGAGRFPGRQDVTAEPRRPDAAPSLEAAADAVAATLARHGVTRAVVAGLSMGGYVALALVERHPELVAGLALVDTKSTPDDDAGARQPAAHRRRGAGGGSTSSRLSGIPRACSARATARTAGLVGAGRRRGSASRRRRASPGRSARWPRGRTAPPVLTGFAGPVARARGRRGRAHAGRRRRAHGRRARRTRARRRPARGSPDARGGPRRRWPRALTRLLERVGAGV